MKSDGLIAQEIYDQLERDRESGKLSESIWKNHKYLYGNSKEYPGKIERLSRDGSVVIGAYENGQFIPESIQKTSD